MNEAAASIVGTHDFTSFSKRNKSRPDESFVRNIEAAGWTTHGTVRRFEITANAFTHQMVRSLVGLLVEIGRGRRPVSELTDAIAARSRAVVPSPAPPQGLTLWKAHYES